MSKSNSSRLRRNVTKNNKKTTIFSLVGLFAFLAAGFFLFPYVIEGIGNLAGLMSNNNPTVSTEIKGDKIITPPALIDVPDATSSARIILKGKSSSKGTVQIYVNGILRGEIQVDKNEEFETDLLRLKDGKNEITTKLSSVDGDSKLSSVYNISSASKDPTLDISFPQNEARLVKADKRIEVQGKTEPDNTVTINGARAIVGNDGSFSYFFELNEGDNELTIIATSQAQKTVEKKLKVNYSRE